MHLGHFPAGCFEISIHEYLLQMVFAFLSILISSFTLRPLSHAYITFISATSPLEALLPPYRLLRGLWAGASALAPRRKASCQPEHSRAVLAAPRAARGVKTVKEGKARVGQNAAVR